MDKYTVANFRLGAFATGNYSCTCAKCFNEFDGDKRALSCLPCAVSAANKLKDQLAQQKELVASKFVSGNGVPVERITITRTEWDALAASQEGKS